MPRDPSFEYPKKVCLVTARTIASRLWFVNTPDLQEKILAHLAKYQEMYGVKIFAFILMGNHYHLLAQFPKGNRYKFIGAFNSIVAKLTAKYQKDFIDGKLWGRRARIQVVPNPKDVEDRFLYVTCNPISSGLVSNLGDFDGYRCMDDSVNGQSKVFKLVNWKDYNNRKRRNKSLKPKDCLEEFRIIYSRLPGCEGLSREQYKALLLEKMAERREKIIKERKADNLGFAGKEILRKIKPGAVPRFTKTSDRFSKRPLVLTLCAQTRAAFLQAYFSLLAAYREASHRFRNGDLTVEFPPGSHRPRAFVPIT